MTPGTSRRSWVRLFDGLLTGFGPYPASWIAWAGDAGDGDRGVPRGGRRCSTRRPRPGTVPPQSRRLTVRRDPCDRGHPAHRRGDSTDRRGRMARWSGTDTTTTSIRSALRQVNGPRMPQEPRKACSPVGRLQASPTAASPATAPGVLPVSLAVTPTATASCPRSTAQTSPADDDPNERGAPAPAPARGRSTGIRTRSVKAEAASPGLA